MKVVVDQAKHELAKEISRMAALLHEIDELKLTARVQEDQWFRAKEKQ